MQVVLLCTYHSWAGLTTQPSPAKPCFYGKVPWESSINKTACSGSVGGNLSTRTKPTRPTSSTQEGPSLPVGSNPDPSGCEVTLHHQLLNQPLMLGVTAGLYNSSDLNTFLFTQQGNIHMFFSPENRCWWLMNASRMKKHCLLGVLR